MAYLKPGTLGLFDSASGLIPVRIERVGKLVVQEIAWSMAEETQLLWCICTHSAGVYHAGERMRADSRHVYPRGCMQHVRRVLGWRLRSW